MWNNTDTSLEDRKPCVPSKKCDNDPCEGDRRVWSWYRVGNRRGSRVNARLLHPDSRVWIIEIYKRGVEIRGECLREVRAGACELRLLLRLFVRVSSLERVLKLLRRQQGFLAGAEVVFLG